MFYRRRNDLLALLSSERTPRWVKLCVPPLVLAFALGTFLMVREASPYDDAVARAIHNRRVQVVLGAPVSASSFFFGSTRIRNGVGRARIRISLSGSIQDGTLSADAIQTDGVWGFNSLEVVADDGTQVNVLHF